MPQALSWEGLDPSIDSVEIKVTAGPDDSERASRAFALDGAVASRRRVYFFDTTALSLFGTGIILRVRRIADDDDDSTAKLRPVVPSRVAKRWRDMEGFKLEVDVVGDKLVCTASLSARQARDEIENAVRAQRVRRLFARRQESLLDELGTAAVEWKELHVLGPVEVHRWVVTPRELGQEVTVDRWHLAEGLEWLQMSIRVEPAVARAAHGSFTRFLHARRIATDAGQETMTRTVLEHLTT
jgi:hypothetical protein